VRRAAGFAVRLLRLACPAKWHSHLRGPEGKRAAENRALVDEIRTAHAASGGRYGSPRVHAALRAGGKRVGRRRVERLMRRHGVRGLVAQRRRVQTTDSRRAFPVAPNLLDRKFTAAAPSQVWLSCLPSFRFSDALGRGSRGRLGVCGRSQAGLPDVRRVMSG